MSETIEVTNTVFGFDEVGETSFDMDVSERTYEKLQDAEDEGVGTGGRVPVSQRCKTRILNS